MEFLEHTGEKDNIWTASSNGDLNRVIEILSSGEATVDAQDEYGYSALHAAVSYGHMELIKYLIHTAKANIRLRDIDGDEPIHVCEEPHVFEYLVEHGADPTALNNEQEDIFKKAIDDENEEMVNYLISKGIGQASERLPQFHFHDMEEGEGEEFQAIQEESDDEPEESVDNTTADMES